jgi:molecular chaperone DnaK
MPKVQQIARDLIGRNRIRALIDEVVVLVQAFRVASQGDVKDVLLLDVTPLTLSIETAGVATR